MKRYMVVILEVEEDSEPEDLTTALVARLDEFYPEGSGYAQPSALHVSEVGYGEARTHRAALSVWHEHDSIHVGEFT